MLLFELFGYDKEGLGTSLYESVTQLVEFYSVKGYAIEYPQSPVRVWPLSLKYILGEDVHKKPTGRYYRDFEDYFMMDGCDRQEIAVSVECPWCHKKIHVKDEYKKI